MAISMNSRYEICEEIHIIMNSLNVGQFKVQFLPFFGHFENLEIPPKIFQMSLVT